MKKLILFTVLASLCIYLGCNKVDKSELAQNTPNSEASFKDALDTGNDPNSPLGFRSCGALLECEFTITTTSNAMFDICGDLPAFSTGCGFGCSSFNNDTGFSASFDANSPRSVCTNKPASVCLRNVTGNTVILTVQFNGGSAILDTIPDTAVHCFHTNSSCQTLTGCI